MSVPLRICHEEEGRSPFRGMSHGGQHNRAAAISKLSEFSARPSSFHVISVMMMKSDGPHGRGRVVRSIADRSVSQVRERGRAISRAHRHCGFWKQTSHFCKRAGIQARSLKTQAASYGWVILVLRELMEEAQEAAEPLMLTRYLAEIELRR